MFVTLLPPLLGLKGAIVGITIHPVNDAPVAQDAAATLNEDGRVTLALMNQASDVDGDTLTYSAAAAAHGTVSGGTNGVFSYTGNAGYTGSDSFQVTASDGRGGTVKQTVNITVQAGSVTPQPVPTGDIDFRFFASAGFAGKLGGSGQLFGTNEFQDITFDGSAGAITFDTSFNKGGDVIRLPGRRMRPWCS